MVFKSIDPSNKEVFAEYPEHSEGDVEAIVLACHKAHASWARQSIGTRAALLRAVAAQLRRETEPFAELMAKEMGKPLVEGRAEVHKCAWVCEYYAENAAEMLAPKPVATDATHSFVSYQPLGVIVAIMPWNFPLWQVFRAAVPALMAGNGVLLKHAPNVMGCATQIERLLTEAGLPGSLFRSLRIDIEATSRVLGHPLVRAATLTGSVRAGRAVAARAGELIKKTVLELGGSDPYLILADADLELAARVCAQSRLVNGGQSCIAAKRFVVVESVQAEFEERFVEQLASYRVGDPCDEATQLGPMAREDLRRHLHEQVTATIQGGARVLLGCEPAPGPGLFYPPSALTDVPRGTPAYDEELFGPVAAILPVPDEPAAIRTANDTVYGLGAAVFTRDVKRGERIAETQLMAGCCAINTLVKSDPRLPFGGVKSSGYGRELGVLGIREFVNAKTVYRA
jgi:succinate-semialdehyde dehydrogenase/glutarate-semialdehyde dehydrogenase